MSWQNLGEKTQLRFEVCKNKLSRVQLRLNQKWLSWKIHYYEWQVGRLEQRKEVRESREFMEGDNDE